MVATCEGGSEGWAHKTEKAVQSSVRTGNSHLSSLSEFLLNCGGKNSLVNKNRKRKVDLRSNPLGFGENSEHQASRSGVHSADEDVEPSEKRI